jgi:hypothetical protein
MLLLLSSVNLSSITTMRIVGDCTVCGTRSDLALDPKVLLEGRPVSVEPKELAQILYPTPMILSARVTRLCQGTHSWVRSLWRHRFVYSENAFVECTRTLRADPSLQVMLSPLRMCI